MNTKPVNLVIFSRYCRTILVVKRHYPRVFSLVCEEFLHTVRGRQHGDHSFDPAYIPTPKIVSKTVAYSRYGGGRRQKAKALRSQRSVGARLSPFLRSRSKKPDKYNFSSIFISQREIDTVILSLQPPVALQKHKIDKKKGVCY